MDASTRRETPQQIRERLDLPEPNRGFWRKYVDEGAEACIGFASPPTRRMAEGMIRAGEPLEQAA
jgi:hypothetical protein